MSKKYGRIWHTIFCIAVGTMMFIAGCRYAVTHDEIQLIPTADNTGRTIVIIDLLGQRDTYVVD